MVAYLSTSVGLHWALTYAASFLQARTRNLRWLLGLVRRGIRFDHSGDYSCSKLLKLHVFLETDRRKQGEKVFLRLLLRPSNFARSKGTEGSSFCSKITGLEIRTVYRGSRLIRFSPARLFDTR